MQTKQRIETYLMLERQAQAARHVADKALSSARDCKFVPPKNLRPARASDIKRGRIIWYPEYGSWEVVQNVLCPESPWKGYESTTGCLWGLCNAFVEAKLEM